MVSTPSFFQQDPVPPELVQRAPPPEHFHSSLRFLPRLQPEEERDGGRGGGVRSELSSRGLSQPGNGKCAHCSTRLQNGREYTQVHDPSGPFGQCRDVFGSNFPPGLGMPPSPAWSGARPTSRCTSPPTPGKTVKQCQINIINNPKIRALKRGAERSKRHAPLVGQPRVGGRRARSSAVIHD